MMNLFRHRTLSLAKALLPVFLLLWPAAGFGELLETGQKVEKTMQVGETHSYQLQLAAGTFVKVVFEKHGLPLVVTLLGPDGEKLGVFGSNISRNGAEPVTFLTTAAGVYRLEVTTYFKPSAPGTYQVELLQSGAASVAEKSALAQKSCQPQRWLDASNNFLVDSALTSIAACMTAVGQKLEQRYPDAAGLTAAAKAQIDYLISRWHWGEFVSPAYQQALSADFEVLADAAAEPEEQQALAMLQAVAEDLSIKAAHCRSSPRGLGGDIPVVVTTTDGIKADPGWSVFYKLRIFEFTKGRMPEHFPKVSSPTRHELAAGKYIIWGEKVVQGKTLRSQEDILRVGDGKPEIDWDLMVSR